MKYSIKFSLSVPECLGIFPLSFFELTRYDSGNYKISYDGNVPVRITARELQSFCPRALKEIRKKAGVREISLS